MYNNKITPTAKHFYSLFSEPYKTCVVSKLRSFFFVRHLKYEIQLTIQDSGSSIYVK